MGRIYGTFPDTSHLPRRTESANAEQGRSPNELPEFRACGQSALDNGQNSLILYTETEAGWGRLALQNAKSKPQPREEAEEMRRALPHVGRGRALQATRRPDGGDCRLTLVPLRVCHGSPGVARERSKGATGCNRVVFSTRAGPKRMARCGLTLTEPTHTMEMCWVQFRALMEQRNSVGTRQEQRNHQRRERRGCKYLTLKTANWRESRTKPERGVSQGGTTMRQNVTQCDTNQEVSERFSLEISAFRSD
jgi:hypothetical protein